MKENHFRSPYSRIYGENRKTWPPEVFLTVLLHELRNPIAAIKGWTEFLSIEETKEHVAQGIESIAQKITTIDELHKELEAYVSEHRPQLGA